MDNFFTVNQALQSVHAGQRPSPAQYRVLRQAALAHRDMRPTVELGGTLSLAAVLGGIGFCCTPGGQGIGIPLLIAGGSGLFGGSVVHNRGTAVMRAASVRYSASTPK